MDPSARAAEIFVRQLTTKIQTRFISMANPPPVPAVAALLNPANVITATFNTDGSIAVDRFTSPDGGVTYVSSAASVPLDASNTTISFEFGVDPGNNPKNPNSALLLERDDNWDNPWDDEVARVLGGQPYPFGTTALPSAGNSNWGVFPRNTLKGVFSGPLAAKADSQMVILGVSRASTSAMTYGGPIKYLSLWLPAGATGYVKFCLPGQQEQNFPSIAAPVAGSVAAPAATTTAAKTNKTTKTTKR